MKNFGKLLLAAVVTVAATLSIYTAPIAGERKWEDPCPKVWSERKQGMPPKKYWREPIMKEGVDFEYWPQWQLDTVRGEPNTTMGLQFEGDSLAKDIFMKNPKIKIAICEGITGDVLRMSLIHEYAHLYYGWEDHKGLQWLDVRTFTKQYPKGSLPR